jgi:hypothetical protein
MKGLSNDLAVEFCEYCNIAYVNWVTFSTLFPENFGHNQVKSPAAARALHVVNVAFHEQFLHSICKLHDPAIQQNQINLGIDFVVRFGGWEPNTMNELMRLKVLLDTFADKLRSARNKILSHNDLERILSGTRLGAFVGGEDVKYFENLEIFVNIVHQNTKGGDLPFNRAAKAEAEALHALIRI